MYSLRSHYQIFLYIYMDTPMFNKKNEVHFYEFLILYKCSLWKFHKKKPLLL